MNIFVALDSKKYITNKYICQEIFEYLNVLMKFWHIGMVQKNVIKINENNAFLSTILFQRMMNKLNLLVTNFA